MANSGHFLRGGLRLRSLSVVFGGGVADVELSHPQHIVIAPERLRARAVRDAACAVLHGPGLFSGGRRSGIRRADLRFEVNGIGYRCGADLVGGDRVLAMVDPGGGERVVASGDGPVAQMLGPLLHLPGALIYRTLSMVDLAPPTGPLPTASTPAPAVPFAMRPALIRYLDGPDAAASAVREARATADGLRARRDELAGEGGALDVVFRRAARRREAALDEVDSSIAEAERAAAALAAEYAAVTDLVGRFEATAGPGFLEAARRAARPEADPGVVDHVEVFVGDPPSRADVDAVAGPFEFAGDAGASAAQILAAGLLREGRTPPLFWLGDAPLATRAVDWAALWALLGRRQALLFFVDGAAPPDGRPVPMVLEA